MIYRSQESYNITGAAMYVYNTLGPGFLEAVYQEALAIEFSKRGIPFQREKELKIYYDGHELKQTYRADFVCYDNIIVEIKAVGDLDNTHRSQVYNYLKAIGCQLGLLYNFGHSHTLQQERKVMYAE